MVNIIKLAGPFSTEMAQEWIQAFFTHELPMAHIIETGSVALAAMPFIINAVLAAIKGFIYIQEFLPFELLLLLFEAKDKYFEPFVLIMEAIMEVINKLVIKDN